MVITFFRLNGGDLIHELVVFHEIEELLVASELKRG